MEHLVFHEYRRANSTAAVLLISGMVVVGWFTFSRF